MCAKNHLLIFSSFLDIWENVEWPRFFGPPCRHELWRTSQLSVVALRLQNLAFRIRSYYCALCSACLLHERPAL